MQEKNQRSGTKAVQNYISAFAPDVQKKLQSLRSAIRAAAPAAEETLSYGMPAYKLNGYLVYFAAFKNHIGFYATPSGHEKFDAELRKYNTGKGSVQFPHSEQLPLALIQKIVKYRVAENLKKQLQKEKPMKKKITKSKKSAQPKAKATSKKSREKVIRNPEASATKERVFAETATHSITPFLMYNANPEEAAKFYSSIFKNCKILMANSMQADFILNGQRFFAYNGGDHPNFKFNWGVSFMISVETQKEVDYYWNALTADGGTEGMCGWVQDKFGLSWQITPKILMQLTLNKDRSIADRAMQAMLKMKKIDIAALRRASLKFKKPAQ